MAPVSKETSRSQAAACTQLVPLEPVASPQKCPDFWHLWASLEEEELSWDTH